MDMSHGLRVCLFGAAASGNLGLAALRSATVSALTVHAPGVGMTVFDDGLGLRQERLATANGDCGVMLCGARNSRRLYRPEAYWTMRACGTLGGLGNAGLTRIDQSHAVLDLSGGDSFSDIYGARRFRTVAWPKRLALYRRRPLVLLPQTYGPFHDRKFRELAASLVRRAAIAWARDADSYRALRELVGDDFDPSRHREGVDVAFALDPRPPAEPSREWIQRWRASATGPVAGVNVSGLLAAQGRRFGLRADPWRVTRQLCEQVLAESDARILLVPHVRGRGGDDDRAVTDRLHCELAARHAERVAVMPEGLAADQVKWIISQLDWFVGMRMHATIAALSTEVPTAGFAYSMKMRGVFATVGQEKHVADARHLTDEDLLDVLWQSWQRRSTSKSELRLTAPEVRHQAHRQLSEAAAVAIAERHRRGGGDR